MPFDYIFQYILFFKCEANMDNNDNSFANFLNLLNTKQSGQSNNIPNTQPIKDMSSVSLDSFINHKEQEP